MRLEELLPFNCTLLDEEIKSSTKREVIFEMAPNTVVHSLLSDKTGAKQSVSAFWYTMKTF